jgi:hypothetical protein|tara:strand:- start:1143 stop:1337 length:195 start_codon:yes stop_codon:yes gene_type:complete
MSKVTGTCPATGCSNDVVGSWLGKVGITRSLLISLALVPFAWDGVLWFRDAIATVWDAATTWGG